MKTIFIFTMAITLVISSYTFFPITHTNAESINSIYSVDTLKLFAKKFGVYQTNTKFTNLHFFHKVERVQSPMVLSENQDTSLELSNKQQDNSLKISNEDENLLARLVHAEAKGEPFEGKVAVAEVVLNRVEHKQFPDTVPEVIYEKNAFEPVLNGSIHESADDESHKAVQEALKEQENDDDLLYFYNPETATSDWIFSRKVIKTIGNHAFAS
ncbi:cell wall hydrolase [Niallia sp. 03133]|uniref:cell wall hydrolase n=1 Tax=Niallia sp. 03133 TaxID=3458060 RepID=UPI004043DAFB